MALKAQAYSGMSTTGIFEPMNQAWLRGRQVSLPEKQDLWNQIKSFVCPPGEPSSPKEGRPGQADGKGDTT